ncbi:apoptosis regulatory protein Siva [Cotesia typhae]|uniref:apoptosis regulatory protein Siva n=1 Tax=Cotesia typhae TaxID=2053667 RepID=UPI003D69A490
MSSPSKQNYEESMKKRFCPFDDNLTRQLKVHIGLRESADKDEKEKELQKIYDRTIQMLKNGPKITNATNLSVENKKKAGYHFELPKFKQMILTNNLELEVSKKLILPSGKKPCSNCKRNNVIDSSCFLCIEFHCSDCLNKCSKCSELFCSKCSLTIYDGGEHVECLACY